MLHNIPNKYLPRKALLDRFVVPTIIVLVGVGAFGLGRLSIVQGPVGEYTTMANCEAQKK